jgi:hypothetical protein
MLKQAGPRPDPHGPQVRPPLRGANIAQKEGNYSASIRKHLFTHQHQPWRLSTDLDHRGRQTHQRRKDAARRSYHGKRAASRQTLPGATKERILGAAFLRLTAEAYLLLDPRAGTPRERWQWLLALHAAAERDAWQRGLEDVHAWLSPPIAKKFGKRIARLGWLRDDAWTHYCKRLQERKD